MMTEYTGHKKEEKESKAKRVKNTIKHLIILNILQVKELL